MPDKTVLSYFSPHTQMVATEIIEAATATRPHQPSSMCHCPTTSFQY